MCKNWPMRAAFLIFLIFVGQSTPAVGQVGCSPRKYCKAMINCAEAVHFYRVCGHRERDGDNDGIPCENVCGKTRQAMEKRLQSQTFTPSFGAVTARGNFNCDRKKSCRQMVSCEEAKFQLRQCGNQQIDGNRDGIPCNRLCR